MTVSIFTALQTSYLRFRNRYRHPIVKLSKEETTLLTRRRLARASEVFPWEARARAFTPRQLERSTGTSCYELVGQHTA